MGKVRCYECSRTYDWQEDPFCPKCGAFNRPDGSGLRSGMAVRKDGLNEAGHKGSFLHRELHAEDSQRRRVGLEYIKKKAAPRPQPYAQPQVIKEAGRLWTRPKKQSNPGKVAGWIVLAIILWNFFGGLLLAFL